MTTNRQIPVNKNLLGYCGLYCGDCPAYTGIVADKASELREVLQQTRFDIFARQEPVPDPKFKHYAECYDCLGALMDTRCPQVCRDIKDDAKCDIRGCCIERGYDGCWECGDFEDCSKLTRLTAVHEDAHLHNLRIIAKEGISALVESQRRW
ncbi:DUF3795 domain-containing protein [bacterium]|nr:DUF3795 domain-containing protein [bacterium]MBU1936395.1 DUF3795 domain-containing protein [bacterium]